MKNSISRKKVYFLLFLIQIFSVFWISNQAHAVTTTISYAGTAVDIWGWDFIWTNPSNATWDTTLTSADSTIITRTGLSNFLGLKNFNLSAAWLPASNVIINGIQVDVEAMVNGDRIRDNVVQLTKDGTTVVWNNYANYVDWPEIKTIWTYGSLTDLWWTTWTNTELLSSNFWVIIQSMNLKNLDRTVYIYRVSITIDYTIIPPAISPGWVETSIQFWLKANAGTSTTTDWTPLNTWNDQSINWYNATAWVAPIYLNNTTSNLNFYPIVDFNGTDQYMENLNNWAYSHSYFAVIIPDNQIDWTTVWQVPFWFDCNSWVINTWICWLPFSWLTLWAFTAAINDEVITHAIWSSVGRRSAQVWTASYQAAKPMLVNMNENATANWTEISEKWAFVNNYSVNTYQTLAAADYRIWMSADAANPFPYNWKIAEIINYSSRTSPIDKQKIESYLSLKYGMTLNSGTDNYIASNWTTNMWSTASAWVYINDIFGIGRDDLSALWQVKSKSVNDDNVITIEAIWEWANMAPAFVDIADFEFLTVANNDLWNTWTATDTPTGYFNLSRLWKVQEIWDLWTLNLDFDVANPNFDIPALSLWTNYYFIYDSNNNGLLSDETPSIMTNTSWSIWRIAWVNLNNDQNFTITTQASSNNIPTDIILSSNNIDENVVAGTTVWTLSTTDADAWDTHTYTFIAWAWDTDNSTFTITTNTLSINLSPDYELKSEYYIRIQTDDWNWWIFQKQFIIYINNLPEAIHTLIDFENIADESKYTVTSWIWTRTTTNPYEWSYSIESDNGWLPNTQSCFQVTNTFNTTWTVKFFYNVSSQAWGDFLRFYIDNIEQQAWSWTVPWTLYSDATIISWTHEYKWCYIKDATLAAWTDNAFIDYITFNESDSIPPTILSTNYEIWALLPWWNHDFIINYSDGESGIDILSDNMALYKWDGVAWWSDISTTWFVLASKIVTSTSATYSTNNLAFWKYLCDFSISDNMGNTWSISGVFYVDEPEFIVNTWSLDIWKIEKWIAKFSPLTFDLTVKTVWAWFDVIFDQGTTLTYGTAEVKTWDLINWVFYNEDQDTLTTNIMSSQYTIINTEPWSINTNWDKNTYIYSIKLWALAWSEQAAWDYTLDTQFLLELDY